MAFLFCFVLFVCLFLSFKSGSVLNWSVTGFGLSALFSWRRMTCLLWVLIGRQDAGLVLDFLTMQISLPGCCECFTHCLENVLTVLPYFVPLAFIPKTFEKQII